MTTLTPRLREISLLHNPFRVLRDFDDFFRGAEDGGAMISNVSVPPFEFVETPETYQLKAEVPGLEAKDVELQVNGELLTISGEKHEEKRSDNANIHFTERRFGKWQRSFRLPSAVDPTRVEATIGNGILNVTIGKRVEAKSQVIKVKPV